MKIRCVACGEVIYDCTIVGSGFAGDRVLPEQFVPLRDDWPVPRLGEKMLCPICNEPFVARTHQTLGGVSVQLEDGSWWPHPPIE